MNQEIDMNTPTATVVNMPPDDTPVDRRQLRKYRGGFTVRCLCIAVHQTHTCKISMKRSNLCITILPNSHLQTCVQYVHFVHLYIRHPSVTSFVIPIVVQIAVPWHAAEYYHRTGLDTF